jgi:hypothetical protein
MRVNGSKLTEMPISIMALLVKARKTFNSGAQVVYLWQ